MKIIETMRLGPVIPVIVIDTVEQAVPLARALVAGGVRVLELTLRTPAALDAIRAIAEEVEGAIVGVGTLTRPEDFDRSIRGRRALRRQPRPHARARRGGARERPAALPGVMTPSDVIAARSAGFTELKLFPAREAGGIGMLKALGGPFPDVVFCPTGGVTAATAPDLLALPNVACVGGSWLTPADLVAKGDWAQITELARQAAALKPRRAA